MVQTSHLQNPGNISVLAVVTLCKCLSPPLDHKLLKGRDLMFECQLLAQWHLVWAQSLLNGLNDDDCYWNCQASSGCKWQKLPLSITHPCSQMTPSRPYLFPILGFIFFCLGFILKLVPWKWPPVASISSLCSPEKSWEEWRLFPNIFSKSLDTTLIRPI